MTFCLMTTREPAPRRKIPGRRRDFRRSVAGVLLFGLAGGAPVAAAQDAQTVAPLPRSKPSSVAVSEPGIPPTSSACVSQLVEAGAAFQRVPPPDPGGLGCRIEDPVQVTRIGETRLVPSAVLACATALKLSRFLQRPLKDEVRATMNTDIDVFHVAASFDCRGRNRQAGAKLSEHGYGRAVDLRGLTFTDGTDWSVSPRDPKDTTPAARFQRRVRALACGPFTTVLGPGSDAYHDDHFHFDLAPRNAAYCR